MFCVWSEKAVESLGRVEAMLARSRTLIWFWALSALIMRFQTANNFSPHIFFFFSVFFWRAELRFVVVSVFLSSLVLLSLLPLVAV